jgi:hypothetical protein
MQIICFIVVILNGNISQNLNNIPLTRIKINIKIQTFEFMYNKQQLYNHIIKNISKTVKQYINEAFDFGAVK